MKKIMFFSVIFLFSLMALNANGPSRFRALIHSATTAPWDSTQQIIVHFIPAGNLATGVSPLIYLGLGLQPIDWLNIETVFGWRYDSDELIGSTRIATKGFIWTWTDLELSPETLKCYIFSQANTDLYKNISVGIEAEAWGNYKHGGWSIGGGPNLLIRYKQTGVDLAYHFRQAANKNFQELFIRFHLFL